jgi:outer membrane protein OmpA-like peptidoglycan-associated protein
MRLRFEAYVVTVACVGCAQKAALAPAARSGQPAASAVARVPDAPSVADPIPPHSMGIVRLFLLNYPYWDGWESYRAAESAAARQQWRETEALARDVVNVNPDHAAARKLLATALAMQGKNAEASEHLSMALADDWLRWGPGYEEDPALATFRAAPEGRRFERWMDGYRRKFEAVRRRGLWLVGRRAHYEAPPTNAGAQFDVSRAEILLYDPFEGRYHRITHTDESVLGFKQLANGDIVYVANRQSVAGEDHFRLSDVVMGMLDGHTLSPKGKPVRVGTVVDRLVVREQSGTKLRVIVWTNDGRQNPVTHHVIDVAEGISSRVEEDGTVDIEPEDLVVSHFDITLAPQQRALECDGKTCLRADGVRIEFPGPPDATYSSPDGRWAVVRVADKSCKIKESTLHVVRLEGDSEAREIHKAANTFHRVRWLGPEQFLFEADVQSLVRFSVGTMRQDMVVRNPAGLALNGLGLMSGPCDAKLVERLAAVSGDWIRVMKNVEFEFDSAELRPGSYAILDEIAGLLRRHRDIARLEVQGHADRHASHEYNLKLSLDRANAVRHDLITRGGIAEHRLIARGYGKSRPLDRSTTNEADATNRRVGFKILERRAAK